MQLCKDCKYADKSSFTKENWKCFSPSNITTNYVTGEIKQKIVYCESIRTKPECDWFLLGD